MLQLCTLHDMQCNKTNYSIMKETQNYRDFTQLGATVFKLSRRYLESGAIWVLATSKLKKKIETTVNLSSVTE